MQMKPFPWKCPRCREKAVRLSKIEYVDTIERLDELSKV